MGKRRISINRYILPIVYFLLTFLFEKKVLLPEEYKAVAFSVSMNDRISVHFEQWMCYAISKAMAAIIISLAWKLIGTLRSGKIQKKTITLWGSIWLLSIAITIMQWPEDFLWGGDNYIPFSYSIRLVPEYWHSIYLSCLYTASMMLFPHAISISLLQCTFFILALAYLYYRIECSNVLATVPWLKYSSIVLLVFRDSFSIATNPERAEYNTSFLLFFISLIVIDMIDRRKRSNSEFMEIMFFTAFLAVFRAEGIVVATLAFIVWLYICYRPKIKKMASIILLLVLLIGMLKIPGKIGEIKYYGKDYSLINTFASLRNIFNAEDSNLTYVGAEDDLDRIGRIVPVGVIAEYGSEGYRRLNYLAGRADINQSMVGEDYSKEYLSAYYRIVLHNISQYTKTQVYMVMNALGANVGEYNVPYTGTSYYLEEYGRELWDVGIIDVQNIPGRFSWVNSDIRNNIARILINVRMGYFLLLSNSYIYFAINVLLILISIVAIFDALINYWRNCICFLEIGVIASVLDIYILLMSLMMPVGANMYFHAYVYCIFVIDILFIGMKCIRKNEQEDVINE